MRIELKDLAIEHELHRGLSIVWWWSSTLATTLRDRCVSYQKWDTPTPFSQVKAKVVDVGGSTTVDTETIFRPFQLTEALATAYSKHKEKHHHRRRRIDEDVFYSNARFLQTVVQVTVRLAIISKRSIEQRLFYIWKIKCLKLSKD